MLSGKTALVTNVCHFVGIATAQVLQKHGASVRCHDASFADLAVRSAFEADNTDLRVLAASSTTDAVDQAVLDMGKLDIVVINDFFPALRAPMGEATAEDFRDGLEALMVVPFETASAAARHMKPQRSGKMVFVTSAPPRPAAYMQ